MKVKAKMRDSQLLIKMNNLVARGYAVLVDCGDLRPTNGEMVMIRFAEMIRSSALFFQNVQNSSTNDVD
eukprot:scaffold1525_cov142-Cylindrotheca_fusiformis.AAC.194